jgi:hypothetical protein
VSATLRTLLNLLVLANFGSSRFSVERALELTA